MKKMLFLLLIWTGINSFKTANPVVEATIGANVPLNTNIRQMLGKKDGVVVIENASGDNRSLSFYDEKNMQLLSEKKIYGKEISAEDVKYYMPYKTLSLKNTIVLILVSTGKNKKNGFYAKTFDYKGNALTGIVPVNENAFGAAEAIKMQQVSPETNYYDFYESFVVSQDSLSWAAYSIPLTPVTTGNESFRMTVLDEQAKTIAVQDVSLPYKDKEFGFISIALDKNKAAYILGYLKQAGSYKYILSKIDGANAFKVTETVLPVPHYIKQNILKWNGESELRMNGVYSKLTAGKFAAGGHGCFALNINTTSLTAGTFETYVLPATITDKMDYKPEKDLSIYGLTIDKVVKRNDGGYYVVLDHYYKDEVMRGGIVYSVPEGMSGTIYHSDELIVLSYDKANKVSWSSMYKKSQQGLGSDRLMAQDAVLYQNGLVILYNDSEKNIQNNTNEYYMVNPEKMKAAVLYADDKGNISRSPVAGLSAEASGRQLISMRAFTDFNTGSVIYSDVFTYSGKTLKSVSFSKLQVR